MKNTLFIIGALLAVCVPENGSSSSMSDLSTYNGRAAAVPSRTSDESLLLLTNFLNSLNVSSSREKTADEIIEQSCHQPEYMSCADWLTKERPGFSEENLSSHPLFPLVQEAMALADFEVDILEGFIRVYMETNMTKEQALNVPALRINAMASKFFARDLIDIVEGKTTIEAVSTAYFLSRLEAVADYKKELTTGVLTGNGIVSRSSLKEAGDEWDEVKNGFLRSHNKKNEIIRELLYSLREKGSKPLNQTLPKDLIALITLSSSLHPFLDKKDDSWIGYDYAIECGEVENFLGNAHEIGISELQNTFINIQYTPLKELSQPAFIKAPKKKKKKKKVLSVNEIQTQSQGIQSTRIESAVAASSASMESQKSIQDDGLADDYSEDMLEEAPSAFQDPSLRTVVENEPLHLTAASSVSNAEAKISNDCSNIIYNIFSPKGYTRLSDKDIIKAWVYVLKGRGYHKENTGRSHQPLYSELGDGSRAVLGLFRSSSYGPNYMKYVRRGFEAIGFGKDWLKQQGYSLD